MRYYVLGIFFYFIFVLLSRFKEMNRLVITAFSGIILSLIAWFFVDELSGSLCPRSGLR